GDGALATLLHERFPEKAKRPPGAAADPKSFSLPGVTPSVKVATVEPAADPSRKPRNGRPSNPDLLRTQEDEPAEASLALPDPADGRRLRRQDGTDGDAVDDASGEEADHRAGGQVDGSERGPRRRRVRGDAPEYERARYAFRSRCAGHAAAGRRAAGLSTRAA